MNLLSAKQAAARLGIGDRGLRLLIEEGRLAAHKLGREDAIEEPALAGVKVYGKAGRPTKTPKKGAP